MEYEKRPKYCCCQSHYREVQRCENFLEQILRFGLDFGTVGFTENKIGSIMSNILGRFFKVFMAKEKKKKN
jgi:hypothetical protein